MNSIPHIFNKSIDGETLILRLKSETLKYVKKIFQTIIRVSIIRRVSIIIVF